MAAFGAVLWALPVDAHAVPRCSRALIAQLDTRAMRPPGRDSERYLPPSADERDAFALSLRAFARGDHVAAVAEAAAIRYRVCRDADVVVWAPLDGSGRAHVAWRVGDARPAVVGVPHPLTDLGTLRQGLEVFRRARLRALVVSGTHRCASALPSGCPGATHSCRAPDEPYRLSDMAHNHETLYHVAHEVLADLAEAPLVLSLHGMNGAGAIVSDGTDHPAQGDGLPARLTRELAGAFPGVRSCNDLPGVPSSESLCGTLNAQGLLVNAEADTCHGVASTASGRFVHLEQSRRLRRRPKVLARVLRRILSDGPGAPAPRAGPRRPGSP